MWHYSPVSRYLSAVFQDCITSGTLDQLSTLLQYNSATHLRSTALGKEHVLMALHVLHQDLLSLRTTSDALVLVHSLYVGTALVCIASKSVRVLFFFFESRLTKNR